MSSRADASTISKGVVLEVVGLFCSKRSGLKALGPSAKGPELFIVHCNGMIVLPTGIR
jgi:hypothetical protein